MIFDKKFKNNCVYKTVILAFITKHKNLFLYMFDRIRDVDSMLNGDKN